MYPIDNLLIAIAAVTLLSGLTLIHAVRVAVDGYEDECGFHAGLTPAWIMLGAAASPVTVFAPDASVRAAVPEETASKQPEARSILGSKPPMLPADLQAEDLNPRPPQRHEASDKADTV